MTLLVLVVVVVVLVLWVTFFCPNEFVGGGQTFFVPAVLLFHWHVPLFLHPLLLLLSFTLLLLLSFFLFLLSLLLILFLLLRLFLLLPWLLLLRLLVFRRRGGSLRQRRFWTKHGILSWSFAHTISTRTCTQSSSGTIVFLTIGHIDCFPLLMSSFRTTAFMSSFVGRRAKTFLTSFLLPFLIRTTFE